MWSSDASCYCAYPYGGGLVSLIDVTVRIFDTPKDCARETYSYSGLLCCLGKEIVDILSSCGAPLCPVVVTSLEVVTASLQVFRRSSRYKSGVVNCFVIKLRLPARGGLATGLSGSGASSCSHLFRDIDIYCGLSTCSHLDMSRHWYLLWSLHAFAFRLKQISSCN